MRLVIDTNILVSALISPDGTAFQLLSDILDNRHEVIINKEIFQEYDDVLHRERFGFDEEIISFILDWFRYNAIWIEVTESQIPMPDGKDRIFYDAAKCTKSRLVTGNNRHYPVDELVTSLWELK